MKLQFIYFGVVPYGKGFKYKINLINVRADHDSYLKIYRYIGAAEDLSSQDIKNGWRPFELKKIG